MPIKTPIQIFLLYSRVVRTILALLLSSPSPHIILIRCGVVLFFAINLYIHDFSVANDVDDEATIIVASNWVSGKGEFGASNFYHATPAANAPLSLAPLANIQLQSQNTLRQDSRLGFAKE